MVCEVRPANLIKPLTLKLCESRSVVPCLPHRAHHEDWGIPKQEPCPRCNHFQAVLAVHPLADLIALYNHLPDMETAPQRAKQTINKLVSFALWLQVSRVTFCLSVLQWPSWWFWWARINISWHISLLLSDHNILTLFNSLNLGIRTGLSWAKIDKQRRSSCVFGYSASPELWNFPLECFLMSSIFQILPHCERDQNIWDFTRRLTKTVPIPCILQHQTIM